MKRKVAVILLLFCFVGLSMPAAAIAQKRGDDNATRNLVRRGKNGVRIGDGAITLFDGPGIINYEHRHRWMEGPAGAATVIGIGAGAGAVTGGVITRDKKGAVIGALIGAGAATGLWLYKNRRHKHKIF